MTLVEELVDSASGDAVAVSTLLRRLKVLASRTGVGVLADWVEKEINGYAVDDTLPPYRGPRDAQVLGNFVGFGGSSLVGVPVPSSVFPEEFRKGRLFSIIFYQSVAELEALAAATGEENLAVHWPADAIGYAKQQAEMYSRMKLLSARVPVMRAEVRAVLDSVRNRVLDLALELERSAPTAGETEATSEAREMAAQVINANFLGAGSTFALGSNSLTQVMVSPPGEGDRSALLRYLGALGVPAVDIEQLESALSTDEQEAEESENGRPGRAVAAWLSKLSTSVATSAVTAAATAAVNIYLGTN